MKKTLSEKRAEKIIKKIKQKKLKWYTYYNLQEDFDDVKRLSWLPITELSIEKIPQNQNFSTALNNLSTKFKYNNIIINIKI